MRRMIQWSPAAVLSASLMIPAAMCVGSGSASAIPIVAQNASSDVMPEAASVQSLVARLSSGNVPEQVDAVIQLGAAGPYAQPAVGKLVELLKTDNPTLQYECIATLGRIGPLAQNAADQLTQFLTSDSGLFQAAALESLRHIGTASADAKSQIVKLCSHADAAISTPAIRCLVMIEGEKNDIVKSAIPRLVASLKDKRGDVRNDAAAALKEIGSNAIPKVIDALTDSDPRVRLKACDILGQLQSAESNKKTVAGLVARLEDENELVVRAAIRALGEIHAEPAMTLPALSQLLAHKSLPVRISAVRAIGEFGTEANETVPAMLPLLSDPGVVLRKSVVDALGHIGGERADVIESLVNAMSDVDGTITVTAANALGRIGAAAVPALTEKLSDEAYRGLVVEVLGEIGPAAESAVPALVKLVQTDDKDLQREVFIALATIGPKAASATPIMMTILADATAGDARAGAAYVLARTGENKALPQLKQLLKTGDSERVRRAAAWALVALEPQNTENVSLVMPHLLEATSSEMVLARKEAMSAFAMLGPAAEKATPAMIEHAATDPDAEVRAASLHGLAEVKAPAQLALPVAIAALNDSDIRVRNSARYLIGRLGKDAQVAVPQLRETLRQGDEFERVVSAWALVHVESSAENSQFAVPILILGLQHPNPRFRAETATTLASIGAGSAEALKALQLHQEDDDPAVREAVAKALEVLKPGR